MLGILSPVELETIILKKAFFYTDPANYYGTRLCPYPCTRSEGRATNDDPKYRDWEGEHPSSVPLFCRGKNGSLFFFSVVCKETQALGIYVREWVNEGKEIPESSSTIATRIENPFPPLPPVLVELSPGMLRITSLPEFPFSLSLSLLLSLLFFFLDIVFAIDIKGLTIGT